MRQVVMAHQQSGYEIAQISKDAPEESRLNMPEEKQGELFSLDSPLLGGVQGERSLMAYPFFALTKAAWTKPLAYRTDEVSIEIGPGPKGVATIYDKEILLYIASLMVSKLDAGQRVGQTFQFTANDLFRVTGINSSSRSYSRLSDALERLQGTQIKTNIEAGGSGEEGFFSWLEAASLQYTKSPTGEKRLKSIKVRLCDWLYRAIMVDRHVLEYAPSYFELGPVERRLYEVSRSLCVDGPVSVALDDLRLQLGYQASLRHFKYDLTKIIEADVIPGFRFVLEEDEARATTTPAGRTIREYVVKILPEGMSKRLSS
ncbi:replication initiator protein A [Sphingomonas sp. BK069]|uniref:replication initiator protein A n=1 Tax=Sphingomonas sp. BK069 TaxID=2586979 RepID=UPI0017B42634|nr:replication initiator protein A [Sphingomonas sp. BK069]MBB3349560.1 plasmid replication initiation protein [Sphingomonas sp. BK069]